MTKNWGLKSTVGLALALALSTGAIAQQTSYKFGLAMPLTGGQATYGNDQVKAAEWAVDEINKKGGVLGKQLEPVVVDPASNWPLFAEKTKQLLGQAQVAVFVGCWTSVSRKSVLPGLTAFLQGGGRKIDAWYAALKVADVRFDDEAEAFSNINTVDELRTFERS